MLRRALDLTSLDPHIQTTGLYLKKNNKKTPQFGSFQSEDEPEITQIYLKGEQRANYKDQLSNKMGKGLFKPHGLYFSANVTDTTQMSQSEQTQMESRDLQQALEIKLGRRSGITGKSDFAA